MSSELVSPNDLFKAGVDMVLKGVNPTTPEDWVQLLHFWSFNISADALPDAVMSLCQIFRAPIEEAKVLQVVDYYQKLAVTRREEELRKLIGKPVTHEHLKHVRAALAQNLDYDGIVSVFTKANLPAAWPDLGAWEQLGRLCNALF